MKSIRKSLVLRMTLALGLCLGTNCFAQGAIAEPQQQEAGVGEAEQLRSRLLDINYTLLELAQYRQSGSRHSLERTIGRVEALSQDELGGIIDAGLDFHRLDAAVAELRERIVGRMAPPTFGGAPSEEFAGGSGGPSQLSGLPEPIYSGLCGSARQDPDTVHAALEALWAAREASVLDHRTLCDEIVVLRGKGQNDPAACEIVDDTLLAAIETADEALFCWDDTQGAEILANLDRLEHVHTDLESVATTVDDIDTTISSVEADLTEVKADTTAILADVADVQSSVDDVTATITSLTDIQASIATLTDLVQVDLDGDVANVQSGVDALTSDTGFDLDGKVFAVDAKVLSVDSKVLSVDSKVLSVDSKVLSVDSKVLSVDSKVVQLDSFVTGTLSPVVSKTAADVVVVESKIDNLTLRMNLVEMLPLEKAMMEGLIMPIMTIREENGGMYEAIVELVEIRLVEWERLGRDTAQSRTEQQRAEEAEEGDDLIGAARHLAKALAHLIP